MKTHIALFLCHDGMEYGMCQKLMLPNSTPKAAMKKIVAESVKQSFDNGKTAEDRADIADCVRDTMSTFQKSGGGIYTCTAEEGTYVVTEIR